MSDIIEKPPRVEELAPDYKEDYLPEIENYPIPESATSRVRRNRKLENSMIKAVEQLLRGEK